MLTTALGSCSRVQADNNQPPNIIFILLDDHAFQAISSYGGRFKDIAPTPNIDSEKAIQWLEEHGSGVGRLNPAQRAAWDAYYNPIKERFEQEDPRGDDLILWKYQRYMHDYHATMLSVDKSVGILLDYLKEQGLDKNTISELRLVMPGSMF